MRLTTKNGWILTEYTGRTLLEKFDGSKEEFIKYVLENDLSIETFSKYQDKEYWIVKPRFFIGGYDVYPNSEGIIATEK